MRAAIVNSQYDLPSQRLTINLAPADVKKEGGVFDLAIALGVLAASGQCDPAALSSVVVLGELSLEGRVRPVPGTLPIALALRRERRARLLVPAANAAEAAVAEIKSIVRVYRVGEIVEGPIVKLLDFGAIVELGRSQDGMIHVSELKQGFVKKVEDVVKLGDFVRAKIVRAENGKIGLSL